MNGRRLQRTLQHLEEIANRYHDTDTEHGVVAAYVPELITALRIALTDGDLPSWVVEGVADALDGTTRPPERPTVVVELPDVYVGQERGAVLGADADTVYLNVKRDGATHGPNTVIERDQFRTAIHRLGIEPDEEPR